MLIFNKLDKSSLIIWRLKIQYTVHKRLPLDPIPSHMNLVQSVSSYFCKSHFNTVTPSKLPSGLFSEVFCSKFCTQHFSHACYMSCPFSINSIQSYTQVYLLPIANQKAVPCIHLCSLVHEYFLLFF